MNEIPSCRPKPRGILRPIPLILSVILALGGQAQGASVIITGSGANDLSGVTTPPQDPQGNSIFLGDGTGKELTSVSGQNTMVGSTAGAGDAASSVTSAGSFNSGFGSASAYGIQGDRNTAVGAFSGQFIQGNNNFAGGNGAGYLATGDRNTMIGDFAGSSIVGSDNIAIGTNANYNTNTFTGPTASNTIAIGTSAQALDTNAVAIGTEAYAGTATSTSYGTYSRAESNGTSIGYDARIFSSDSVTVGNSTRIFSPKSVSVGVYTYIDSGAEGAMALGYNAKAMSGATSAVAIGRDSIATEANTVSVGSTTQQRRITNVADGVNANDAVNVSQLNALNVDPHLTVNASNSLGLGHTSSVGTTTNSVALGEGSVASEDNTVSVGSATQQRRITNVAEAVNGTDAVNLDQLNSELGTQLGALDVDPHLTVNASDSLGLGHTSTVGTTTNSVALGEGSVASEDNTVSVGSTTQQRRVTNVADAVNDSDAVTLRQLNNLDTSDPNLVTNANSSVGVGQTSSVGTTTNSVALGEGSVASEDNTVSVGSDTQKRRITNLADGVADSDAATIGQLRALELSDSNLSGRVNSLSNRVDDLDERMDNVGAMAAAMSGAHAAPQAMGDTQLALGVGNYNGSNAVAAGLFHYLNNKTLLSAGVSKGGSETAVSLGATFAW